MRQRRIVMLDIDGVLADNTAFEQAVTRFIIARLADFHATPLQEAEALWCDDLRATRGDHKWYDYDYHCARLGLPPLARQAHASASSHLRPIRDSLEAWKLFLMLGASIQIVTDACRWVAEFKLGVLGLGAYVSLLSSNDTSLTKAAVDFWRIAGKDCPPGSEVAVIDNSPTNILAAAAAFPAARCVHFDSHEHVSLLPVDEAPRRTEIDRWHNSFPTVHSHLALMRTVREWWG